MRVPVLGLVLVCGLAAPALAQRVDVTIPAIRDVTLYEDPAGQLSNDAGPSLFVGETGLGAERRALLAFDIQANVPPNAHIVFVQMQLTVSLSPPGATPVTVDVHRVTSSWPEGTAVAIGPGGQGTSAGPGDCTWLHRPFPSTFWAAAGGDFSTVKSGTFAMPVAGVFALGSSAGMVADVQGWLNGTVPNHGWLLKTRAIGQQNARRLHSRETTFVGVAPQLQIGYVAAGTSWSRGAGCVASNGLTLRQSIVGAPIRGTIASLALQNGLPLQPTATLIATTLGQVPVDIVPGCPYELDSLWIANLGPIGLDAQGAASYTFVVPNNPALVGAPLSFQSVQLDTAVPALVTFSNGTVVVFG